MNWITKTFFKPKYILVYLRIHQKTLHVVKKKRLNSLKTLMKQKEKHFVIDIQNPCYMQDNIRYYFIDIDSGKQYTFSEIEYGISPEDLDTIVGSKIIRELTKGVMDNRKTKLSYFILGLVIGLLLGVCIMNFIMQNKVEGLMKEQIESNNGPVIFPSLIKTFMLGRG